MTVSLPIFASSAAPVRAAPSHFDTGPRSIAAVKVLRISITDRCNFRCLYCMPEQGVPWLPKDDLLSLDEILAVAQAAIRVHGIRRFKLTGGEPTLHPDLPELIRRLRALENGVVQDISLTTNGFLLARLAAVLKDAGLDRITISIDSLQPDRFKKITRTGDLAAVLAGLDAVERAGFQNTKINCVTMRGTNDNELPDFARLTLTRPLTVRFIEYMPLGDAALLHEVPGSVAAAEVGPAAGCGAQDRGENAFVSETEARQKIEAVHGPLLPVHRETESGVGPANVYRLSKGKPRGRIGFISAMSAPSVKPATASV